MTITAGATSKRTTHHISLTNNAGTTTIGLKLVDPKSIIESPLQQTSLKMSQGDTDYSDFNLPFTPITQKDWSGGRAQENFENDKTRYSDSYQVDTTHGDIRLAPYSTLTTGIDVNDAAGNGTLRVDFTTAGAMDYVASSYCSGAIQTFQSLDLWIANRSSADIAVTVSVYTDVAGSKPGTPIAGATGSAIIPANMEMAKVRFPMTFTTTHTGVYYWIVIPAPDANLDFGVLTAIGTNLKWFETGAADWEDMGGGYNDKQFSYSFATIGSSQAMFFEYKGALYSVINSQTGGAPKIYINGYRGLVTAGATVFAMTITGVSATLTGKIIKIVSGLGYDQQTNWREVDHTTAGVQYIKPAWDVAPDATSEVVVLGCDLWTEIGTGVGADGAHGLTKSVTDICIANGIVYFAQGEATNMRRMREYNNSGTWTRAFDDDGTNKATFLEPITATTGKVQVWKGNNPTDGSAPNVSYSGVKAWGTALDFATKPTEITGDWPVLVGDSTSKITGIAPYGTPTMPWVMKEDSFGAVSNGIWAPVPISEMRSVRSEENGAAVSQFGVYLYFSLLDGLDKYYDNRLDDVGPNRDQGLSLYRRGAVAKLIPYPGRLIALIDGGNFGYSSIMVNMTGWHEIHQGQIGRRIRGGTVQVIPGAKVDRLWFEEGGSIYWMPMAVNPDTTSGYVYTPTGYVISSWMNGGFREINKFWSALQIFAENLTASTKITAYYQTDVSTTWVALGTDFTTSPMQKVAMTTGNTAYGKRWRYKLQLTAAAPYTSSPKVKAVTVESITRVPMKSTWTLTAYADDAGRDIQGAHETLTAKGLLDQLKTWANSDSTPTPLTMHSNLGMFDSKTVFIENPRIRPVNININGARQTVYVAECSVIGVD